jgi:hypothetical protein
VLKDTPLDHFVDKEIDHILGAATACDADREDLFGELIDQREDLELRSKPSRSPTKDVILIEPSQPNTRSVGEPESSALGLLLGYFKPLLLPDPLHP